MRIRQNYATNGVIFAFLLQAQVCLIVIGGQNFCKNGDGFFHSRDSCFLQSHVYDHHQTT